MFDETSKRPLLDEFYQRFLQTENSADFIFEVAQHYTAGSLTLLADAGQRVTRRAAILALGFVGDFSVNPVLGQALTDDDRGVRLLADHGIRQLWFRVGKPNLEVGLRKIVRLNRQHRFACAIDMASDLVDIDDCVAEAWNQRAIACYNLEDYVQAIADCRQALELNPWHFLAALGSANCHLELGNVYEALNDFRLSLEINPDLEMVRSQIDQLQRIVEG
ncbi:MAG: tetratricopeptide repeat protein [Pirellulaceae bacterium]